MTVTKKCFTAKRERGKGRHSREQNSLYRFRGIEKKYVCERGKRRIESLKLDLQFFDYEIFHCPLVQEMCVCVLWKHFFALSRIHHSPLFSLPRADLARIPLRHAIHQLHQCTVLW